MARKADVRQVAERQYWREADARVVIEGWHRSSETLSGFARRHGIAPPRLARWVRRLEGAGGEVVRFHPVRVVEREPERGSGAPIEIHLAGGQRVRVPHAFEAEDLRRVLVVLAEVERC